MQKFKYIECQYVNMVILKTFNFKTVNGLPVFPKYFESVTFEHETGPKNRIDRVNGKYTEYMKVMSSWTDWELAYRFTAAQARKELKYFLTDPEYKLISIRIGN